MKRWRRPKLFRVTRVEQVQVVFFVEATSALKARHTPTPVDACRVRIGETVGETAEQYAQQTMRGWAIRGVEVAYSVAPRDRQVGDQVANSGAAIDGPAANSVGRDYPRSTSEQVVDR